MTFEYASDDEIRTVGEYFRKVRIQRELSLAEIASEIKIHEKYLAAIEDNDDTVFEARVYKELFMKSYADFLGLSVEEILLRMPEMDLPQEEEPKVQPPKPAKDKPLPPPKVVTPAPRPIPAAEEPKRSGSKTTLVLFLVLVILGLSFALYKLTREPKTQATQTEPAVVLKPKAKVEVETTTVPADTADSNAVDQIVVDTTYRLLLVSRGKCWLGVRTDSSTSLKEEMLKENDTLWFSIRDSIYFKFGRANAVDVWFNAVPLRLVEPNDTNVASFVITPGNYVQFVDSARIAP